MGCPRSVRTDLMWCHCVRPDIRYTHGEIRPYDIFRIFSDGSAGAPRRQVNTDDTDPITAEREAFT